MDFNAARSLTNEQAREHLEKLRWPNGAVCAHCGSTAVTKLAGKSTRPGVYKCKAKECRKQFTVTVNSIFADTHIELRHWIMAFSLMCSSKKGISALQLKRMLGLGSYEAAWFIAHRVRHAMKQGPMKGLLKGVVESDETWVGGVKHGKGRAYTHNKTAVQALVERGGNMRARAIGRVTPMNLKGSLADMVDDNATLHTDELTAYKVIGRRFKQHETVNHSKGEYERDGVHVNSAESFFALLKRGVHGTFHHVGKQHLQRYCDEFSFRWNHRKTTDAERTEAALKLAPGCRLTYKTSRISA